MTDDKDISCEVNCVLRHIGFRRNEYIGHVSQDGYTYETHFGQERLVGRVDLDTGEVFESRLEPEKYVGCVDIQNGKVYQVRQGPDEQIGRVRKNGQGYFHPVGEKNIYLGKVRQMISMAYGGAAFLLLLMPTTLEAKQEKRQVSSVANIGLAVNQGTTTTVNPSSDGPS